MPNKIPVLMYHALDNNDHPCGTNDPGELVYVINTTIFDKQMEYLFKNGYQAVTSNDLLSGKSLNEKSVVIGFDDGHVSNYTLALPILNKYGFTAEVYVTTDWIGKPNYLSEEQISELFHAGIQIGSHGASHRYLSDLSKKDNIEELSHSKSVLENIIGGPIYVFAAPGGRYNDLTISCLRELNYKIAYTSKIGYYTNMVDIYHIPRFAIKRDMGLSEFRKIIKKDLFYLYKKLCVTKSLNTAKKCLGNKLYEHVRSMLIKSA